MSPVTVMKRSPILAASAIGITWKPSMTASRARSGSTSVTMTLAPMPLARIATPAAAPAVAGDTTVLPASRMLVARMMPSSVLWPVP